MRLSLAPLFAPGLALALLLAADPLNGFAANFQCGVKLADLDAATFTQWVEGAESPATEGPAKVVWTERSQPGYGGVNFGDTKSPGVRHLRLGFTSPVAVGTVLARGGGALSVLKPDAPYPGRLDDDSQWLPAERLKDGQISRVAAAPEDYVTWLLPPGTATRALRFTRVAEATEKSFSGWLGAVFVLGERLANVAPQAVAAAGANSTRANLLNNESHDHTWGTWDNFEESGTPLVAEQPPEIMLVWPRAVTLRGLAALWAGFDACEVQVFAGAPDQHPKAGAVSDWGAAGTFDRVQNQYTSPLGVNWLPFAEPVTTRAVRVRLTRATTPNHPHLDDAIKGGRRVWLGELLALQSLGDAPLASAILPAAGQGSHPPIPVRFTLAEPGYVTLVLDDARGRRVRNLVSETPFPAGENVAWWDGLDDLARDPGAARHGVYNVPGKFVAPGEYRVRGIWHRDVELRYEFPVYTAGQPAWNTEDRTGGWLSNHTPPSSALFVPGDRAPGGRPLIFLGSYVSEGTHGLAWVDLDGRKVGGVNWLGGNWTGAPFLARDDGPRAVSGVRAYAGSVWQNDREKPEVELRLSALTGKGDQLVVKHAWPLPAVTGAKAEANAAGEMSGLAVRDGVLVVSLKRLGQLLFADARDGKILGAAKVESPRGLAFDREGRLLVLSGSTLRRHVLGGSPQGPVLDGGRILVASGAGNAARPLPLPATKEREEGRGEGLRGGAGEGRAQLGDQLDDPQQLALDDNGNVFISDHGRSHQVKVFSGEGKFLRAIGKPGVPAAGPYDELRMNHPKGLALDDRGRLWVAEEDDQPKRVSVWTVAGKFERAFYGPAEYGGGGRLDAQDRTQFHYHGMTFRLDWERGESRLERIFYRTDAQPMPLASGNGPPEVTFTRAGRRYFANPFNSSPTGGAGAAFIFIERDGLAVPAAGFGRANDWEVLKGDAFKSRWPGGVNLRGDYWPNQAAFFWSDLDGDGRAQPGEVKIFKEGVSGVTVLPDLSFVASRVTDRALRFAPVKFTDAGAPQYDFGKGEVLARGVHPPQSSGGDQALVATNGWTVLTLGVAPFAPASVCGVLNGEPRWSYPNVWPGLHASHESPPPDRPGLLIGTTRLLGGFIGPRGSDAGPLWCVNGNMGPMYLFTADGLFVRTLFRDSRQGKPWSMPVAQRGMRLNDLTAHDENFWPTLTQTADGGIFLCDGSRSSLVRVDGLETLRRLPESTVRVGAAELKAANDWSLQSELARQQTSGSETLTVALRERAPVVDGRLDDWDGAQWAVIDKRGVKAWFDAQSKPYDASAALCVADGRLFAAFRTGDPELLKNSGEVPNALFKTGGALDLMLGTDPAADPQRTAPVAGDLRLLVTRVEGKVRALLYRAVVPGTRERDRVPFASPWRTIYFDQVTDVSRSVQLADRDGGYELAVPLAVLGLRATPGSTLRGDVGLLRGSGFQTTQRVYWSNQATGITADVPSEAMLTPSLWGRFSFQPAPAK